MPVPLLRPSSFSREPLSREEAERLASTMRAIADPTRLQLLSMINGASPKEANGSDLAADLGLTQATVSHHLQILHKEGILTRTPRGRQVWYAVAEQYSSSVSDLLR